MSYAYDKSDIEKSAAKHTVVSSDYQDGAADAVGDIYGANREGVIKRDLKQRHVQMVRFNLLSA